MTISSIITTTLLSLSSAAVTPGPIVNSTFPKYGTVVPPVTGTELGNGPTNINSILPFYSNVSAALTTTVGTIRGYRNELFAFPT
jgi:hypothetical protein